MLRFFKRPIFLLLLVTVCILTVIIASAVPDSRVNWVSGFAGTVLSPLQKIFSYSAQKINDSFIFFMDIKALKQENDKLKSAMEKLEKENRELTAYRDENKKLKEALNLKDQFNDYSFIGANIIAKDIGNWFNVFTIDRGLIDGVAVNYPVITGKGLVGKVISTGRYSSRIISIIDEDSTVSARVSKTRDYVLVKGDMTLKDRGLCRMDYIPPNADIAVGDLIETSGMGGIFPKGIIIGKVGEVRQTSNELTRYAIIKPIVDFKRLEEVIVLEKKSDKNGMDSAEK